MVRACGCGCGGKALGTDDKRCRIPEVVSFFRKGQARVLRAMWDVAFFDPLDKEKHDWIGIHMGVFDTPTKTKLALHIFVAEKGDYYEITDGLPQNEY